MASRSLELILKLRDDASKALQKLGTNLESMEPQFKRMSVVGTAGLAAISAGVLKSVSDYGEFNTEIQRAGAFVNASAEEMAEFERVAISAAKGTTFSFNETAEALGAFVGGEIDAATASKELAKVVDLALVAGMESLQDAVNLGSLALTVFKDEGMEMSDVIDTIATVAADVTTETDKWSTAIVNSAGSAKAAGFTFGDLNKIFALMKRGGADVNSMWSAFNSAITNIQSPTKQAFEALDSVQLSVGDMRDALDSGPIGLLEFLKTGFDKATESGEGFAFLTQVLGREAAPEFALALGLTNEEMEETAGWFDETSGRGAEMVERLREAIPPLDLLKQSFSEISLVVGKIFEPVVRSLVASVSTTIDKIIEWMRENPKLVVTLTFVAAAMFGMIAAIGIIGLAIPAIIAGVSFLTSTFGLAIVALVLIAGVAVFFREKLLELWKTLEESGVLDVVRNALIVVWEVVKELAVWVGEQLVESWKKLKEAIEPIMPTIKVLAGLLGIGLLGAIVLVINIIANLVVGTMRFVTGVVKAFSGAVQIIQGLFEFFSGLIVGLVTGDFQMLYDGAKNITDGIIGVFTGFAEMVKGIFTGIFGRIVDIFLDLYDRLVGNSIIPDMVAAIIKVFTDWGVKIKALFTSIWGGVIQIFNSAVDNIMKVVDRVLDAIDRVRGALRSIGGKVGNAISGAGSKIRDILPFANGGIVTRPTLGLIGEAGPEAVIPLRKMGAFGGLSLSIVVNGDISGEDLIDKVGDQLMRRLKREMRV